MSKNSQKSNYILPSADSLDVHDLISSLEYELDHMPTSNLASETGHSKFADKRELSHRNKCYSDEYGHEIIFYKNTNKDAADNVALYCYAAREPVVEVGLKRKPVYVSFSSMEYENEQLLHFLLDKSKNQK